VVVTPVGKVTTDEGSYVINDNKIGSYTQRLNEIIVGIQEEEIDDPYEWIYPVE
jgi:hypothetical protein